MGVEGVLEIHHTGADYFETLVTQFSHIWMAALRYMPEDFQKIIAPTLIMLGDRDFAIPIEQAVNSYRWTPAAELVIYNGIGHEVTRSYPEKFASSILEFLSRQSA